MNLEQCIEKQAKIILKNLEDYTERASKELDTIEQNRDKYFVQCNCSCKTGMNVYGTYVDVNFKKGEWYPYSFSDDINYGPNIVIYGDDGSRWEDAGGDFYTICFPAMNKNCGWGTKDDLYSYETIMEMIKDEQQEITNVKKGRMAPLPPTDWENLRKKREESCNSYQEERQRIDNIEENDIPF